MAVVRSRQSPPYALIVFIILWVIATGVAIYFYTRINTAEQTARDAQARLRDVVNPESERYVPELLKSAPKPADKASRPSALAEAIEQLNTLKKDINGDGSANTYDLDKAVQNALKDVGGQGAAKPTTLLGAISALKGSVASLEGQLRSANQELTSARETYTGNKSDFDNAIKTAQKAVDEQKAQISQLTSQIATLEGRARTEREGYESRVSGVTEERDRAQREHAVQIEQLKAEIARRDQRIGALLAQIQQFRPKNSGIMAEADGKILRINPVASECYINLGRKDRIVNGMTFSVHDARIGIQTEGDKAKGKGGIEVIDAGQNESLCRITHLEKNQRITPSDLIFNPVYSNDKRRTFHFVVYGAFDIDGDGAATSQERDKVIKLIRDAGGVIDEPVVTEENGQKRVSISPQTDYLVLGAPPQAPKNTGMSDVDEVTKQRLESVGQMQKEYDAIESSAKQSSVPILNANRFLYMMGYYSTTITQH